MLSTLWTTGALLVRMVRCKSVSVTLLYFLVFASRWGWSKKRANDERDPNEERFRSSPVRFFDHPYWLRLRASKRLVSTGAFSRFKKWTMNRFVNQKTPIIQNKRKKYFPQLRLSYTFRCLMLQKTIEIRLKIWTKSRRCVFVVYVKLATVQSEQTNSLWLSVFIRDPKTFEAYI